MFFIQKRYIVTLLNNSVAQNDISVSAKNRTLSSIKSINRRYKMKILQWMTAATCLMVSCTGGQQNVPFVHSVYITQPAATGEEQLKTYSGIVEEAHEISLGFKTAGQLKNILVKEGDFVEKGQLLAELDDADYRLGVEALQIQYDQLKEEVKRTTQLFEQQSISANDYEKATAGLRQLEVQLQVNKNKLEYTKLYAPNSGYIRSVNFSPAEMVDAGTAVFRLLDVSRLEVVADVPVKAYMDREQFTRFSCKTAYTEGKELPMTLTSLTPKARATAPILTTVCGLARTRADITSMKTELILRKSIMINSTRWIRRKDTTITSSMLKERMFTSMKPRRLKT